MLESKNYFEDFKVSKLLLRDMIAIFVLNQVNSLLDIVKQKRIGYLDSFAAHLSKLIIKVVETTSDRTIISTILFVFKLAELTMYFFGILPFKLLFFFLFLRIHHHYFFLYFYREKLLYSVATFLHPH